MGRTWSWLRPTLLTPGRAGFPSTTCNPWWTREPKLLHGHGTIHDAVHVRWMRLTGRDYGIAVADTARWTERGGADETIETSQRMLDRAERRTEPCDGRSVGSTRPGPADRYDACAGCDAVTCWGKRWTCGCTGLVAVKDVGRRWDARDGQLTVIRRRTQEVDSW